MKKLLLIISIILSPYFAKSTIHEILVWDGYMQFLPSSLEIELGDTIQWLPLDYPSMVHTITSSNIPAGAAAFDEIWQAPADTFFQYIPAVEGLYEYVCTPHIAMNMIGSFNVVSSTAGDHTELHVQELSLYPNPAKNHVIIKNGDLNCPYGIYSLNGSLIRSGSTSGNIDITFLVKGSYYIKLTGNRPKVLKFTKVN